MAKRSTGPAAKRFNSSLLTALRIYGPAREWSRFTGDSFEDDPYQPRAAQKIVGLAFLGIVAAWEEFLEETFLSYMTGALSESGYTPRLTIGSCRTRAHALAVLSGAPGGTDPGRPLRWHDLKWVVRAADIYFAGGEPYSRVTALFRARIQDAVTIRNRVAHNSDKARHQFKRVANNLLSRPPTAALEHGYSPGQLLIEPAPARGFGGAWLKSHDHHHWGDIFEAYVSLFEDSAALVSPR